MMRVEQLASGRINHTLRHPGEIKRGNMTQSWVNALHELSFSPDGLTLAVAGELGLLQEPCRLSWKCGWRRIVAMSLSAFLIRW